jgi:hypothetical protein
VRGPCCGELIPFDIVDLRVSRTMRMRGTLLLIYPKKARRLMMSPMKFFNGKINCTRKLQLPIAAAMRSEVHVNYEL